MKKKQIDIPEDIKSGYLVELQNGERLFCTRHCQEKFSKILVNTITGGLIALSKYYSNMYQDRAHEELDIVKVYGLPDLSCAYCDTESLYKPEYRPLLWERKPVEMTKEQIEKELGYKIKIVVE